MKLNQQDTVGDLIAQHPDWAKSFEGLGIDYCCGGKKTIGQACAELGLPLNAVTDVLETAVGEASSPQRNWSQVPLAELCDHIEQVHHGYLKTELPRLSALLQKLVTVHGQRHPELARLRDTFEELRFELEAHLGKEENILFPAIRQLEGSAGEFEFHCGGLGGPISVMEAEHEGAGQALAQMRELTDGYRVPADGCATYRGTYEAIEKLEADLHQHIHKENSILFPRVMAFQPGKDK